MLIPSWPLYGMMFLLFFVEVYTFIKFRKRNLGPLAGSLLLPTIMLIIAYMRADAQSNYLIARDEVRFGNLFMYFILLVIFLTGLKRTR